MKKALILSLISLLVVWLCVSCTPEPEEIVFTINSYPITVTEGTTFRQLDGQTLPFMRAEIQCEAEFMVNDGKMECHLDEAGYRVICSDSGCQNPVSLDDIITASPYFIDDTPPC